MRPAGSSDSLLLLGLLAVLAVSSVGLKAAAGAPSDGLVDSRPDTLEDQLTANLRAQGFATRFHRGKFQSSIVYGQRGNCSLSVRDARGGAAIETAFARDAARIGLLRYFYRGRSSATVPAFAVRVGRFENELLSRIEPQRRMPVPVALATSPGCGARDFGFGDVRLPE
jgi:hypothetical protein